LGNIVLSLKRKSWIIGGTRKALKRVGYKKIIIMVSTVRIKKPKSQTSKASWQNITR